MQLTQNNFVGLYISRCLGCEYNIDLYHNNYRGLICSIINKTYMTLCLYYYCLTLKLFIKPIQFYNCNNNLFDKYGKNIFV